MALKSRYPDIPYPRSLPHIPPSLLPLLPLLLPLRRLLLVRLDLVSDQGDIVRDDEAHALAFVVAGAAAFDGAFDVGVCVALGWVGDAGLGEGGGGFRVGGLHGGVVGVFVGGVCGVGGGVGGGHFDGGWEVG